MPSHAWQVRYDGFMLLLVDGYNVTMRDPEISGLSKEGQRESLLARLRIHGSALAPKGSVVVVFDARGELGHVAEPDLGAVRAVYAPDADTEIVRRCSAATGQVVVATDDMRLRARISQDVGRHVRFRSASELFGEALKERSRSHSDDRIARDAGLPKGANEITAELKKLWLSEDD